MIASGQSQSAGPSGLRGRLSRVLPGPGHPAWALILVTLVAAWLLLTLRAGQVWDGDFALYVMNARNIVMGVEYATTAYVVNPANVIHPAAYPPGVPLLLAPLYAILGVDLHAMKIACVATFAAFLFAYWRMAQALLPPVAALVVVGVVGFHPYFWELKDSLGSEFPFLLFCYAAMVSVDRIDRGDAAPAVIVLAAVSIAMACLTRTAGIVLFPAVALVAVLRPGALRLRLLLTIGLAGAIAAVVNWRYPADVGTYVGYFDTFTWQGIWEGAQRYLNVSAQIIGKAVLADRGVRNLVFAAGLLLAAGDIVIRLRSRLSVLEAFTGGYLTMLLIYPVVLEPDRYSMPLWPMLALYAVSASLRLMRPLAGRSGQAVAAIFVVSVAAAYVLRYDRLDFGPIHYSVDARPARELYAAIEANVAPDGLVITRGPTVIGLYAGRRSSIWPSHQMDRDDEFWSYVRSAGATHFVRSKVDLGLPYRLTEQVDAFVARNGDRLVPLYANEWFELYRFVGVASAGADSGAS